MTSSTFALHFFCSPPLFGWTSTGFHLGWKCLSENFYNSRLGVRWKAVRVRSGTRFLLKFSGQLSEVKVCFFTAFNKGRGPKIFLSYSRTSVIWTLIIRTCFPGPVFVMNIYKMWSSKIDTIESSLILLNLFLKHCVNLFRTWTLETVTFYL